MNRYQALINQLGIRPFVWDSHTQKRVTTCKCLDDAKAIADEMNRADTQQLGQMEMKL